MNGRVKVGGRAFTLPLFLLRCKELGFSLEELDFLPFSTIIKMFEEKAKDGQEEQVYVLPNDDDY